MDWLKEVAAFAKKSASKNEGRDKFLEFASSLPENQHRFAIEKFDHYEKVFAKERAYAPIQSMVMKAAKTLSRDKFDVLLNDVPQEFRSAAARTYHHYRCIFGQRRKINEHACDEFPKMKRRAEYVRVGTLSLEFVFANVGKIVEINELGVFANCDSWRIKAYASKGVTCAHCGISGTFFAIEHYECQPKGSSHLNLYHVTDDGSETMITAFPTLGDNCGHGGYLNGAILLVKTGRSKEKTQGKAKPFGRSPESDYPDSMEVLRIFVH